MTADGLDDNRIADLAICYTTFNSMRTIEPSLASALRLSSNVYVVDSGSTDGTIEHCRKHGIEPVHRDWTNPVEQKGVAMEHASGHAWTLLLDSDEIIEDELADSIRERIAAAGPDDTGLSLNRVTWMHGRPLRHTFQPEWRLRLVRSDAFEILGDEAGGHDRLEVLRGRVHRLRGTLRHDSWADVAAMVGAGMRFGLRTGGSSRKGGRRINLIVNPAAAFLKQLILRRGFLDGWRGWVAAGGVASQALIKHVVIMDRRQRERESSRSS